MTVKAKSASAYDQWFGEDQDGSLRAQKILYDDNRDAFEQIQMRCVIEFLGAAQQLYKKDLSLARFCHLAASRDFE